MPFLLPALTGQPFTSSQLSPHNVPAAPLCCSAPRPLGSLLRRANCRLIMFLRRLYAAQWRALATPFATGRAVPQPKVGKRDHSCAIIRDKYGTFAHALMALT